MIIIVSVLILLGCLILGLCVPAAFGVSFTTVALMDGQKLSTLIPTGFNKINTIVLLAIPLFVLSGGIIERGKLGKALTDFVQIFVGRINGGLGIVVVVASAVFGAISGSAAATLSCIGSIMYPKLEEAHYDKGFAASLIANASPLGLLIPPSCIQIMYAWVTGQSVLACFLATIVPGIILAILLCVINVYECSHNKDYVEFNKQRLEDAMKEEQLPISIRFRNAVPALLMPVIVLGGIYGGVMTPTEAAAVAVIYSIPIGFFVYKGLTVRGLLDALRDSGVTAAVVMLMMFMVMILSRLYVLLNLPNKMVEVMLGISSNKNVILLLVNIFMVIIGMLMDDNSGTLLCGPILLPVVMAVGVSPVQFAAILGVNLGMGTITPPAAPLLYLGSRTAKVPVKDMLVPSLKIICFAWIPTLILTTYFPDLSLFLPRLFGFNV
ncbi:MAG: TRAP transporter large permease [Lachnospiraceae bacterium]|nr:TRAP transporter large permease [Lachnospiraceae bacterium]MBR2531818.1 TRAP transporter large permease [Lachnospiraceae bacterium]